MNQAEAHRHAVQKAREAGCVRCPSITPCRECRQLADQLGLPVHRPIKKERTMIRPRPTRSTGRVVKAESKQILVFDAAGRVVGSVDPSKITPFAESSAGLQKQHYAVKQSLDAYKRDRRALPLAPTAGQRQLVEAVGKVRAGIIGRQAG